MEEILKKLLESEFLSEESKVELTATWGTAVESFKEQTALEVRAELAEQWTQERAAITEKVEKAVEGFIATEFTELKEDVERFRDLESDYAEKLAEEKQQMAVTLGEELDSLVDKIDSFLEYRLNEEMTELKEDMDEVKKNNFGRKIFEAYQAEFGRSFIDEDSIQSKLAEAEDKLADAESRLFEAEQEKKKIDRDEKLKEILAPLSGIKRDQMAIILSNVDTHKLQEAYNVFIGRILKEATEEKVETVLAEAAAETVVTESKVVTGDDSVVIETTTQATDSKFKSELQKTLRLAGVI
jgi:hypothetical protein